MLLASIVSFVLLLPGIDHNPRHDMQIVDIKWLRFLPRFEANIMRNVLLKALSGFSPLIKQKSIINDVEVALFICKESLVN